MRVRGGPTLKFLQSLCTSDVETLKPSVLQPTAFLTNKGRILADAFLQRLNDEEVLIDVAASQRAALTKHLKMYKLRMKLEISEALELNVVGDVGDADLRCAALGPRAIREFSGEEEISEYRRRRLTAGVGEAEDIAGRVPLTCNLDLLGHVSFAKGCYVGQELIARAFYRGTVRKRLFPVAVVDKSAPPLSANIDETLESLKTSPSELLAEGKALASIAGEEVGDLLTTDGPVGLAMLKVDFAKRALATSADDWDLPIENDDNFVLRIIRPSWYHLLSHQDNDE